MSFSFGDSPLLTDCDVDKLACQFLNSAYAAPTTYVDWSLDRRLEGFLRRLGLVRLAEDGDAYDLVLNRVMARIAESRRPESTDGRADERPATRGLRSLSSTGTRGSDGDCQDGDFEI